MELSECLTSDKYNTIQETISYENNMHERAANTSEESFENSEKMHSKGRFKTILEFFG